MSTTRRDDLPPPVSAEAARERMVQRTAAAGRGQRQPLAGDMRQDAAPPRPVSAEAARDRMIARSSR